jgi:hypothetical protein
MYERRRQAASLVSLLVVTLLFVWACSSGGHEDASVTTSGGAGSQVRAGGAAPSEADDSPELGSGGTLDSDTPSIDEGGSGEESAPQEPEPSAGGELEVGSAGASSGGAPQATGGTLGSSSAGGPGAGTSGSGGPAGATAAGGAAVVSEPVCDPADDPSTPDMFLPCDVSTAFYVCRNCHANPPVKGVTTSYVTFADIKANAAQIYGVIKSGTMPWPPYTLSAWQKTTVLKWLGKSGSCAIGAAKSCQ